MLLQKSDLQTNIVSVSLIDSFIKTAEGALRSLPIPSDPEKAYATPNKIQFTENSNRSNHGLSYKQTFRLSFPNADLERNKRIDKYIGANAIQFTLCTGAKVLLGLNDKYQNTRLKCEVSSTHNTTTITYATESIFPVGYNVLYGLPIEIPVDFE